MCTRMSSSIEYNRRAAAVDNVDAEYVYGLDTLDTYVPTAPNQDKANLNTHSDMIRDGKVFSHRTVDPVTGYVVDHYEAPIQDARLRPAAQVAGNHPRLMQLMGYDPNTPAYVPSEYEKAMPQPDHHGTRGAFKYEAFQRELQRAKKTLHGKADTQVLPGKEAPMGRKGRTFVPVPYMEPTMRDPVDAEAAKHGHARPANEVQASYSAHRFATHDFNEDRLMDVQGVHTYSQAPKSGWMQALYKGIIGGIVREEGEEDALPPRGIEYASKVRYQGGGVQSASKQVPNAALLPRPSITNYNKDADTPNEGLLTSMLRTAGRLLGPPSQHKSAPSHYDHTKTPTSVPMAQSRVATTNMHANTTPRLEAFQERLVVPSITVGPTYSGGTPMQTMDAQVVEAL